ncbi:hypothetical protein SAMD00019534_101440 [Acytostelium subglobosum LB1]|uniref:hypothetical protein n=1 Tax=Acytostelium subglobosum LB1 TaxID=1410327 RepID=UPI0006450046|nr:hypothetical protein SAMD00019534_101440 [Acytostelium subglobosum LB1]GAM26969.1 hypothetical protein SAMD00019534_101440 [Acytostelium subglobosum LB1]|eukprot:XP_012750237.1 hypothetical protein SAMD00019534_101440 [Acytostelium subglobosum LB1]
MNKTETSRNSAPSAVPSTFNQIHENDEASMVILNEPSLAQWMGSIHPNGSLYEEPLDLSKAQEEHKKFRQLLENEGCTVRTVREILTSETGDIAKRVKLEEFAFKCIQYELDPKQKREELGAQDQLLLSDDYKRRCIDSMSVEQLVEVILTRPTIKLRKSERDTELLATEYSFQPLVNLVFQRDQQITTAKGIVMASLSSPIRAPEVELMKLCFDILGLPVIGEVPNPGKLEGGDFYPMGQDICYIGVGLRSNFAAVDYLMANDLLGTNRVAVVKDYFDLHQQRMHLDTVFNIINDRVMLILQDICGEQSPIRRLVDEYKKNQDTGKYELARHDVEFSQYLIEQGYELLYVTDQNQKDYGCNGLNIGNGKFIVVDQATAKTVARKTSSSVKLLFVDFRTVTKMYGSVHCCSQVVSRRPTAHFRPTPSPMTSPTINKDTVVTVAPADAKVTQIPNRALMVSPTYFVKAIIGSELINASVVRDTRTKVLQDYSTLHRELRKNGVNIHLFCHEPHHKTDQAVFVAEWFSTHSAAEVGKKTVVLYPMSDQSRRNERRIDILRNGFSGYDRVIDFTPMESGGDSYEVTTISALVGNTSNELHIKSPSLSPANAAYLDFTGLVLDRVNKVVYCAVDEKRYYSAVVTKWAKVLGYTLVQVESQGFAASQFLFIGSRVVLFCPSALSEEDSDKIIKQLGNSRAIITLSKEQMEKSCSKILEIGADLAKPVLIMSQTCFGQFSADQVDQIKQFNQISTIDMSDIENLGGTGINGMVGGLF